MKRINVFPLIMAVCLLWGGNTEAAVPDRTDVSIIEDGIRFSESVYPYDGGLFISNYGSDKMSPRADENKGYILYKKNGISRVVTGQDGSLHKPLGLAVKDHFLFVCDAGRLLVYDLQNQAQKPQSIDFASEGKIVNALAIDGDRLYVSVTDANSIYVLDIKDPSRLYGEVPQKWLDIPGPNGLAVKNGILYIASIPTDFKTPGTDNVIYQVKNLSHPRAEKLVDVPGLYDGIAVADDGQAVYFSDWQTASVTAVDIGSGRRQIIYEGDGSGPADIAQADGVLYIPDLPHSRIVTIKTK